MARIRAYLDAPDLCSMEGCASIVFSERPFVVLPFDSERRITCKREVVAWGIVKLCLQTETAWRKIGIEDHCFMTQAQAFSALRSKNQRLGIPSLENRQELH